MYLFYTNDDNFLHEKGIYGVDCDDLKHKIAETINGKER